MKASKTFLFRKKFNAFDQSELISNTPNPNLAEFSEGSPAIVWKHSTTILAKEEMEITEVGAYLLNNGSWTLRKAFEPKEIKKMFATSSLQLKAGQKIVFEENWRYGNYTQTGWNFWYVIAKTGEGKLIFDYDILGTIGKMEDGTQVLPLNVSQSNFHWTGKAGDSDYTLSGSVAAKSGRVIVNQEGLQGGDVVMDMESITCETEGVAGHLKSKDFFHTSKYPEAEFTISEVTRVAEGKYQIKGNLNLLGQSHPQEGQAVVKETETAFSVELEMKINRVKYGILFATSEEKSDSGYSISEWFTIQSNLSFRKDYPGSMPWNTVKAK